MWNKKVNGTQVGDTIRIFSPMQTFDCSDAHVTSVTIIDEPDLTLLDCYKNEIESTNLNNSELLTGIEDAKNEAGESIMKVWMSHGDKVTALPPGYKVMSSKPS